MFVLRSKYRDLQARHEHALEQLATTRRELADWKGSAIRTADRNSALAERLEATARLECRLGRVLRACVRYRAAVRRLERDNARLQQRLDDACGLDDPAVLAGQNWQRTRADGARKGVTA